MPFICLHLSLEVTLVLDFCIAELKDFPLFLSHMLPMFISITLTSTLQLVALMCSLTLISIELSLDFTKTFDFCVAESKAITSFLCNLLPIFISIALTSPLDFIALMNSMALVCIHFSLEVTLTLAFCVAER